ncbi:hypothetical protein SAMN05216232_3679 [Virgibacillus subterraneus]|uniref:Uncharacterized protein n=1 Tax=Virgibacillus subterraneus TaxID=621109 RepID=A0A1H9JWV1_9BACI|nr:hypothetical protein [Virgibacillus subterraneus]SEQ91277.1 hypothetical protein SAMN05216232_3679 [Virgibacillus subterraneus]
MFTLIFYGFVLITLISVVLAIKGKPKMYWVSALCTYIFSFLGGFSIGQLTVGLTFVFIVLALAYSFNWVKSGLHYVAFLVLGFVIGGIMVVYVDDAWLFFPFSILS